MATHSILVGARTRGEGIFSTLEEGSYGNGRSYLRLRVVDELAIAAQTTELMIFREGALQRLPGVLVLEDIDGVTNECVDELVQSVSDWTADHPDLELVIYWSLIGLAPFRVLELTEKLLPLVQLG